MTNVRTLALLIMFLSLAVLGSMLKLPAALGSIALDSAPALVAAALLGPRRGAFIAVLGHLFSALFAAFPLGVFHLLVALEMGLLIYVFGLLFQREWRKSAYLFFFVGNAFIAPLPFAFLMGTAFVIALLPSLAIGTAANIAVSFIVIPLLLKMNIHYTGKMPHA
ncbi:ECF transporter S component [Bacillus alveayuensis]|jgi:riboflavin transporter|uniref:ECF transporter S component n=1 Tax=Aeribacillus alveayuensis TaxID=279215 RepID=UPI0005CC942E|nr:ECF transporter S component [Bacillus alveayuensis]